MISNHSGEYTGTRRFYREDESNMPIEEFLKSLELPKKYYDSNFDIVEKYEEEADSFISGLEKIEADEFPEDKREKIIDMLKKISPNIEANIHRILDVFKYYEGADPKRAQEEIDAVMACLRSAIFISTMDDWNEIDTPDGKRYTKFRLRSGELFYRVRSVEGTRKDIESNPDELFHIPLSKKALTNNERFSLAGFPSLYLATMLPLAWQESGYPQRYYYSEFQYLKLAQRGKNIDFKNEMKLLALYSPQEIYMWGTAEKYDHFPVWLEAVRKCLMMYPLVMACAFVNHSGKGAYKQEYIIPQMLMQWVQRNIDSVQGISYFTCVDMKMMPSAYCAYDIVIPALAPYDDKKYSQKLRDEFTWTKPRYFEIPLLDTNANKEDRHIIYDYIGSIRNIFRYRLPGIIETYLEEIERVCVCLYHLMKSGNNADIQMVIHTLNLINTCCGTIKAKSLTAIIAEGEKNHSLMSDEEYEEMVAEFKKIADIFLDEDREHNSVATIIDRYRNTLWNDYHVQTMIDIAYREDDNIADLENWIHENHLIYQKHILSDKDAGEMKKEIKDIKTPLVRRFNSVSLYNPDGPEFCDYQKEAFDISLDGADLLTR